MHRNKSLEYNYSSLCVFEILISSHSSPKCDVDSIVSFSCLMSLVYIYCYQNRGTVCPWEKRWQPTFGSLDTRIKAQLQFPFINNYSSDTKFRYSYNSFNYHHPCKKTDETQIYSLTFYCHIPKVDECTLYSIAYLATHNKTI